MNQFVRFAILLLCVAKIVGASGLLEKVALTNAGFEKNLDGWKTMIDSADKKANVTTAQRRNGEASLELKYGPWGGGVQQKIGRPLNNGATVKISAYVLMPTGGSRHNKVLAFEIQGLDSNGKVIWTTSSFHDARFKGPHEKWTRLTFEPTNLAPAAAFNILINTQNGDGNGPSESVFVDDLQVEVVN